MVEIAGIEIAENSLLIMLIIVFSVIVLTIMFFLIKNRFENIVEKTSKKYIELKNINQRYHFWDDIENVYEFSKRLTSKKQYDRFERNSFLDYLIENRFEHVESIIMKVRDNRTWLEGYRLEIKNIVETNTPEEARKSGVPYFIFRKIESKLFEEEILNPVINPVFICYIKYESPKGRNDYTIEVKYVFKTIVDHYSIVRKKIQARDSKSYQRKIMTDSLRYDIFKRDKFRCVLCGRTAQDGVKLHVDHIIPVSKGGKTTPSNLRTLCETCNLGKRDKYDEFGEN